MYIIIMLSHLSAIGQQSQLDITKSCRIKYPNMIPVKISADEGIVVKKQRFLISEEVTGLQLQAHIVRYIQKQVIQSLYFFIIDKKRRKMLQNGVRIKQIYEMYKNQNGYLCIEIMKQNVF